MIESWLIRSNDHFLSQKLFRCEKGFTLVSKKTLAHNLTTHLPFPPEWIMVNMSISRKSPVVTAQGTLKTFFDLGLFSFCTIEASESAMGNQKVQVLIKVHEKITRVGDYTTGVPSHKSWKFISNLVKLVSSQMSSMKEKAYISIYNNLIHFSLLEGTGYIDYTTSTFGYSLQDLASQHLIALTDGRVLKTQLSKTAAYMFAAMARISHAVKHVSYRRVCAMMYELAKVYVCMCVVFAAYVRQFDGLVAKGARKGVEREGDRKAVLGKLKGLWERLGMGVMREGASFEEVKEVYLYIASLNLTIIDAERFKQLIGNAIPNRGKKSQILVDILYPDHDSSQRINELQNKFKTFEATISPCKEQKLNNFGVVVMREALLSIDGSESLQTTPLKNILSQPNSISQGYKSSPFISVIPTVLSTIQT